MLRASFHSIICYLHRLGFTFSFEKVFIVI